MRSLRAILRLIRWENALISAVGVFIGAWWVGGHLTSRATLLVAGAAIALAALANSYNDLADVEIDRISHPERPLPTGALSVFGARAVIIAAIVVAMALTALTSTSLAVLSLIVIVVMIVYSHRLKRAGLPGNVTVAVLASMPFLYGGWSAGRPLAALPLMTLAIPLHLAREIAKDMEDVAGDRGVRRTVPVTSGPRVARNILFASLGAFLGALVAFARTRPLFALAVIPAVVLALIAAYRAAQGRRGAPLYFKFAMLGAMASLLVIRDH